MPRCWLFPVASAWHILARNGPPICSWGNTISWILSPLCHLPAKDYVNLLSGHLGLGPGLSASQSGSLIWTSGPAWHPAVTSQQEQWPSGCWVATHNRATLPGPLLGVSYYYKSKVAVTTSSTVLGFLWHTPNATWGLKFTRNCSSTIFKSFPLFPKFGNALSARMHRSSPKLAQPSVFFFCLVWNSAA